MLAKDSWRNNLYTKKEGVTAVSRMAEEHIFYKNAWTKKLKVKSLWNRKVKFVKKCGDWYV